MRLIVLAHQIDIHVGTRLNFLRREKGLSQSELGNIVGVTFQQIQKYEKASNRLSASKLFQVAQALEVPVGYFFDSLDGQSNTNYSVEYCLTNLDKTLLSEALQLLRSFLKIDSSATRRSLVLLVKSLVR